MVVGLGVLVKTLGGAGGTFPPLWQATQSPWSTLRSSRADELALCSAWQVEQALALTLG